MTPEQEREIIGLYVNGCYIMVSTMYVDGFARLRLDDDGVWLIDSQVLASVPLKSLRREQISVYQEVKLTK